MKQNEVLQELKEMHSPLAEFSRAMPYSVPAGYFDELAAAVRENVHHSGKDASVPADYFQTLPDAMLAAAKAATTTAQTPKPTARVIALPPLRRWAAAAVLLMAFGIGGALLLNNSNADPQEAIAELPADAVQEYVVENVNGIDPTAGIDASVAITDDHVPQLSGLSNAELEAYLAEEGVLF